MIVGGSTPLSIASVQKIASTAPEAPRQWPVAPFVERDRGRASSVLAQRELDHACLARVAEWRRGAVRVDVVDLVGRDAGVCERHPHRAGRATAGRVGLGHVPRVRRDAVAEQLRVDPGATAARMLELLEHENGARFAHHEAVPVGVERPARVLRVVVPPREGVHRAEACDADAS